MTKFNSLQKAILEKYRKGDFSHYKDADGPDADLAMTRVREADLLLYHILVETTEIETVKQGLARIDNLTVLTHRLLENLDWLNANGDIPEIEK